jgi:hypothetical protein
LQVQQEHKSATNVAPLTVDEMSAKQDGLQAYLSDENKLQFSRVND